MSKSDLIERLRGPAIEATLRLIAGAFRRDGEQLDVNKRPRFSIPTRPTEDDDCVVIEALKEAADRIRELDGALRQARCPRPGNSRPDDFEVGQCIDAGECGCIFHVASPALGKPEGV